MIKDWKELAKDAKFRAGTLASVTHISLRHLERFFLRRFHASPRGWLTKLRLCMAKDLIAEGKPTKVVAIDLDYKDAAHFCHQFKKHFHNPPQTYSPYNEAKKGRRPVKKKRRPRKRRS